MDEIKEYYTVTLDLIKLLESQKHDRDEKINKIEVLLDLREELIKSINPPYSETEKVLGSHIVKLEPVLSKLLLAEKFSIQKDIKDLSVKKGSTNKYVHPYESLSTDGVFYDKRN